jgi:CAAX protease family protein
MQLARPLGIAVAVTAVAVLLSYLLPEDWQSTGVGLCLLLGSYFLVLRHDAATIRAHGLSLGGVFEPVPLDVRRLFGALGQSLLWAGVAALIFFPPFWAGFVAFWQPRRDFQAPAAPELDALLTQLLGIAIPEEMFYRGYAQSALDRAFKWRLPLFGASVGAGILLSSAVFALGHFATTTHPARLSVFFPSLVFGWLRAKTGGIGAAVLFHAACNLFSAYLSAGYFGG